MSVLTVGNETVWQAYSAMLSSIWFNKMSSYMDAASFQSLPVYAQLKLEWLNESALTKVDLLGALWGDNYSRFYMSIGFDKNALLNNKDFTQVSTNLVFDDRHELIDFEADLKQWQCFLRLINVIQFQPYSGFYTQKGIESLAYDNLIVKSASHSTFTIDSITESAWELILADAVGTEIEFIHRLIPLNLPVPQCGFELLDDSGEIIAEAFLAWQDHKVVIVYAGYESDTVTFKEKGWQVFINTELDKDMQSLLSAFALN
jgi:hypothetical protein